MIKKCGIGILLGWLMIVITGCFSESGEAPAKEEKTETVEVAEKLPMPKEPATEEVSTESGTSEAASDPNPDQQQASSQNTAKMSTPTTSKEQAPTPAATEKGPSEDQIAAQYKKELVALQGHYIGLLQGLHSEAIADMKAGSLSKQAIYSKYAQKGTAFQEESQAKVNQVLQRMKSELKANGYPVQSVDSLRAAYYAELDKEKNRTMAEVKKALGL